MLNGDETWQHDCVFMTGRNAMIVQSVDRQIIPPQRAKPSCLESAKTTGVQTTAIYKVITYEIK